MLYFILINFIVIIIYLFDLKQRIQLFFLGGWEVSYVTFSFHSSFGYL